MKNIVMYFGKILAVSAVKKAVAAKGAEVSYYAKKVGVWLAKLRLAVAFLERLAQRLNDGELSTDESDATLAELPILAKEITATVEVSATVETKEDAADENA